MSLDEFIAFNDMFKSQWTRWYRRSPPEYKVEPYPRSTPVGVLVKYGQNRVVCKGDLTQIEGAAWRRDFHLPSLARIQVAFAVHYA